MIKDYVTGISEEGFHKVAYLEWGRENSAEIPIICVHGLTRNAHDFDSLAQYLANRGNHVYCPDIVGRGDSDWLKNPEHYTYEQYISDMNALIARTGAKQVDWIGTSMGGIIGMILASFPQTPIRRLILNDIGPQIPVKGMQRLMQYAGQDPDFTSYEDAKKYYKMVYRDFGTLTDEQWDDFTRHNLLEISPGRLISKLDHGVKLSSSKSKIALRAILHPQKALEGTLFDIDLWHIWRKVTCPVFVIHGKQSDILLHKTIEKMHQIHPEDMAVLEVADAGHAPALMETRHHELIHQWLGR